MKEAAEETTKQRCRLCGKVKVIREFGWSKKYRRPTKTCKACWTKPQSERSQSPHIDSTELVLYYTDIRERMIILNEAQAEAAADGLPVDRPIQSLADVWVGEMTEEVCRLILLALIEKAKNGDVNATKLLLEERHRRAGEPTAASVEETFDDLFKLDPLTTGRDTA